MQAAGASPGEADGWADMEAEGLGALETRERLEGSPAPEDPPGQHLGPSGEQPQGISQLVHLTHMHMHKHV